MAETIQLDPAAITTYGTRTQLDITSWIDADPGVDWGDAAIQAYMADQQIGSSAVDYRLPNRQIKIPLNLRAVGATSYSTIRLSLQQKVGILQAEGGTLLRQIDSTPLYADIVNATLHLGGSILAAYRNIDVDAVLELECTPDWYGAAITLDSLSGNPVVFGKLKLSSADAVIAGNYPGRVRVVLTEGSGNNQNGVLWGFRAQNYSGTATAALFYEAEAMTPLNGAAAGSFGGSSGGTAVSITNPSGVNNVWVSMLSTTLVAGTAALTHAGSYRVWARCYSASDTPQFRLLWGVGSLAVPVTNDAAALPTSAAWYLLDLGSIYINPPPTAGTSKWFGVIQMSGQELVTDRIDYVAFQPLDETAGKLRYTQATPASSIQTTTAGTAAANDAAAGSVLWSNPTRALVSDNNPATVALTAGQTAEYLKITGFAFSIPGGATIKGIQAIIYVAVTLGGSFSATTHLVKASTVQVPAGTPSGTGPTAGSYGSNLYGGAADLWGGTWTPSDINSSGFGVAYQVAQAGGSATFSVDYVQIAVYYVLATGFTVAQDAVVYASSGCEIRTEGMFRDAGGGVYGNVSSVVGDLPRIPPSRLENRPVELFVKATRGDFDQLPDSALDNLSVVVQYRPSFLFVGA